MAKRLTPQDFISGITVPDLTLESTLNDPKRAIFLNRKQIIGYMILTNPYHTSYETPKWIMQSLDKTITIKVDNRARSLLAFWMAIEIRNLNRRIAVLESPRTDLGTYL